MDEDVFKDIYTIDNVAEAVDLRTAFGPNVIHNHLNIQLKRGEILGVVGGSGTGKSVLLNTLLGLKPPDAGQVMIMGKDRNTLSPAERKVLENHVGVLFQGGALFSSLTVRENIMVPMREHTDLSEKLMRDLADVKINMVGLPAHSATLMPADLSGGMKKRAGLARALALDPQILFLDEPTAGLDPIGANEFDNLILELRDALGLTVYIVTHDLDTLFTICDRVAVLYDKKIAVAGDLPTVIAFDNPWVQEYFGGPRSRAALLTKANNDAKAQAKNDAKNIAGG